MAIDREKVLAAAQKYVERKKYDKAVLEYERIIQEDPNDARTLLKMGDLQLKMEGYAGAVATYERVGKFYAQQGFSLKAIAWLPRCTGAPSSTLLTSRTSCTASAIVQTVAPRTSRRCTAPR